MDLLPIIRAGIEALPPGPQSAGLRAVVNHIEMAMRHLQAGQNSGEVQLYTDAIYRCNQAFEGSLKELYRVVAGKDPSKTTPDKIERFLEAGALLRPKVINQLTRYRQEWRNPSTHDYTMDFDENEAFLAIVNIAAFTKMAVGQIAAKLAFDEASKSDTELPDSEAPSEGSEDTSLDKVVAVYSKVILEKETADKPPPEAQLSAMLAGFYSKIPNASVQEELQLDEDRRYRLDILVTRNGSKCAVELKSARSFQAAPSRSIEQLRTYLDVGKMEEGVLVVYKPNARAYSLYAADFSDEKTAILVLPSDLSDFEQDLPGDVKIRHIYS